MASESGKMNGLRDDVDVDALLQKLRLNDAERQGVFLAKEDRESLPKVK